MFIIISPAKTLDYSSPLAADKHTLPDFLPETLLLIKELRKKSPQQLSELMGISDKLAELNHKRYLDFSQKFTAENSRQAIFAFKGDVYEGIKIEDFSKQDIEFAEEHLRILSGLYGILKPLDLMQPYRLEASTALKTERGKNLYDFWGNKITEALNAELSKHDNKLLINLASAEYFKLIRPKNLNCKLLNITFKEQKGNELKIIGLFAKLARGKMTRFIIKNRIDDTESLKNFKADDYRFNAELSDDNNYIFTRDSANK